MVTYLLASAVLPAAIWLGSRRLVPNTRHSLAMTVLVTLAAATIADYWADPSNLGEALWFYLVILPCVSILVATATAARLARRPREVVSSALLAILGYAVGLAILYAFLGARPRRRATCDLRGVRSGPRRQPLRPPLIIPRWHVWHEGSA